MRSEPTPDLFIAVADAQPIPSPADGRVREAVEEQEKQPGPSPGSIDWYALRQQERHEAGMKSASAYWLDRGRIWP